MFFRDFSRSERFCIWTFGWKKFQHLDVLKNNLDVFKGFFGIWTFLHLDDGLEIVSETLVLGDARNSNDLGHPS